MTGEECGVRNSMLWFRSAAMHRTHRPGRSLLQALDMALVDPPSLCCDDDELCPACRLESTPRSLA